MTWLDLSRAELSRLRQPGIMAALDERDSVKACTVFVNYFKTNPEGKICTYDLHREQEIEIDRGVRPRWAKNHVFKKGEPESESIQELTRLRIGGGGHMETPDKNKSSLMWYDVASKRYTKITSGIDNLGETDMNDRWIYAYRSRSEGSTGLRIPIAKDSRAEVLKGNNGIQWIPNPYYPLLFYRGGGSGNLPFSATRTFIDLDGSKKRIGSSHIQRCHQSWSGIKIGSAEISKSTSTKMSNDFQVG